MSIGRLSEPTESEKTAIKANNIASADSRQDNSATLSHPKQAIALSPNSANRRYTDSTITSLPHFRSSCRYQPPILGYFTQTCPPISTESSEQDVYDYVSKLRLKRGGSDHSYLQFSKNLLDSAIDGGLLLSMIDDIRNNLNQLGLNKVFSEREAMVDHISYLTEWNHIYFDNANAALTIPSSLSQSASMTLGTTTAGSNTSTTSSVFMGSTGGADTVTSGVNGGAPPPAILSADFSTVYPVPMDAMMAHQSEYGTGTSTAALMGGDEFTTNSGVYPDTYTQNDTVSAAAPPPPQQPTSRQPQNDSAGDLMQFSPGIGSDSAGLLGTTAAQVASDNYSSLPVEGISIDHLGLPEEWEHNKRLTEPILNANSMDAFGLPITSSVPQNIGNSPPIPLLSPTIAQEQQRLHLQQQQAVATASGAPLWIDDANSQNAILFQTNMDSHAASSYLNVTTGSAALANLSPPKPTGSHVLTRSASNPDGPTQPLPTKSRLSSDKAHTPPFLAALMGESKQHQPPLQPLSDMAATAPPNGLYMAAHTYATYEVPQRPLPSTSSLKQGTAPLPSYEADISASAEMVAAAAVAAGMSPLFRSQSSDIATRNHSYRTPVRDPMVAPSTGRSSTDEEYLPPPQATTLDRSTSHDTGTDHQPKPVDRTKDPSSAKKEVIPKSSHNAAPPAPISSQPSHKRGDRDKMDKKVSHSTPSYRKSPGRNHNHATSPTYRPVVHQTPNAVYKPKIPNPTAQPSQYHNRGNVMNGSHHSHSNKKGPPHSDSKRDPRNSRVSPIRPANFGRQHIGGKPSNYLESLRGGNRRNTSPNRVMGGGGNNANHRNKNGVSHENSGNGNSGNPPKSRKLIIRQTYHNSKDRRESGQSAADIHSNRDNTPRRSSRFASGGGGSARKPSPASASYHHSSSYDDSYTHNNHSHSHSHSHSHNNDDSHNSINNNNMSAASAAVVSNGGGGGGGGVINNGSMIKNSPYRIYPPSNLASIQEQMKFHVKTWPHIVELPAIWERGYTSNKTAILIMSKTVIKHVNRMYKNLDKNEREISVRQAFWIMDCEMKLLQKGWRLDGRDYCCYPLIRVTIDLQKDVVLHVSPIFFKSKAVRDYRGDSRIYLLSKLGVSGKETRLHKLKDKEKYIGDIVEFRYEFTKQPKNRYVVRDYCPLNTEITFCLCVSAFTNQHSNGESKDLEFQAWNILS